MSNSAGDDTSNNSGGNSINKDGKRKERLEQNRISARESRKRKKNMIEELQRTVITLSRENKDLNERNDTLRRELVEIGTKNPGVVNIQALMNCSGSTTNDAAAAAAAAAVGETPAATTTDVDVAATAAAAIANPQAASQPQQIQNVFQQQQQALMQQMFAMNPALMMGMMGGMGLPQSQQQTDQQQPSQQAPAPASSPK